jgi:hypothetical protein
VKTIPRPATLLCALSVLLAATSLAARATAKTIQPILQNGSFEDSTGNSKGLVNRVTFNQLLTSNYSWDTWKTIDKWKNVSGPGVEVQTDRTLSTIDAQDGDYYIELDSTANSSISQKVQLSQGTYLLSFWYSPRTALALTNTITYNLGRVVSGQITNGVNGARVGVWVEVKALFSIKSKGNYDLTFAAAGLSDGYGGLIDNVSIETVPLPATGFGLFAALGGLGLMRRRSKG